MGTDYNTLLSLEKTTSSSGTRSPTRERWKNVMMPKLLVALMLLGGTALATASPPACNKHSGCVVPLDGAVASGTGPNAIAIAGAAVAIYEAIGSSPRVLAASPNSHRKTDSRADASWDLGASPWIRRTMSGSRISAPMSRYRPSSGCPALRSQGAQLPSWREARGSDFP